MVLPGLTVDQPVRSMVWNGMRQAVQFSARAPSGFPPQTVIGTVTVSRYRVPIGHVNFKVSVRIPGGSGTTSAEPWAPVTGMHRYRRAFISYASADRNEVLKRTQMLAGVGIDFFQDILTIKPGQQWERLLYSEIDRCDLFLLFWSSAARKSQWVAKEVHYALTRKGGRDDVAPAIIPVIIEGPPPVPAPPELAHLHFNDRMVYFMDPGSRGRWWHLRRNRA